MTYHDLRLATALTVVATAVACIPPRVSGPRCATSTILNGSAESRGAWSATATARRIEGRVLEADDGSPLGNVSVTLSPSERATRTSGTGAFRFDGVPEGSYYVRTEGAAYHSRSDSVRVTAGHGVAGEIRLELKRETPPECRTRIPVTP